MHTPETAELRAVEAMAMLSALSVAGEWLVGYEARESGRDPSAQEVPADARRALVTDRALLAEMLMRLGAALAVGDAAPSAPSGDGPSGDGAPADPSGATAHADTLARVRHFDRLLVLRRVGPLLHAIHQRLLSLYPDVPGNAVEEVRMLELERARLATLPAAAFVVPAASFAARALPFVAEVR